MILHVEPVHSRVTVATFVGAYRMTLRPDREVFVEALIGDDKWMPAEYPPWKWLIEELQKRP